MRSRPWGWNTVLVKLGVTFIKRRRLRQSNDLRRPLRMESLEDRRVLATVAVNTIADLVDGNVSSFATLISNPGLDGKISLREAVAAAASA